MAGLIIFLVISFLVSLICIILGVCQLHSKAPVGINTGEKPPKEEELVDMHEWNYKHGRNFIIYGCALFITLLLFRLFLPLIENTGIVLTVFFIFIIGEVVWLEVQHYLLKKKLIKHS